jgi:adenylate cyclase
MGLSVIGNSIELRTTVLNETVLHNAWIFFTNYAFWSVVIYVGSVIGISLFYAEVSQNMGQGVLNNFFTGKYHRPIEEERIFMFLDMKSSTTIAENIGHVKYFEMLKEYFSDLSDPVIENLGEIYQYVGDEMVVSWKLNPGLQNNNCINCFFAMKEKIKSQAEKYKERFGVMPDFKAGFHFGKVTTGEIGVTKKDIIFTGDVLNTTSRIQALCNTYNVDLLVSENLIKRLPSANQFKAIYLAESELRGREEKMKLFTLQHARNTVLS